MTSAVRRYRALGGITRSEILTMLRGSTSSMGVRDLGSALGLHPNTVREHLAQLIDAGLVVGTTERAVGRGRPRLVYSAGPDEDPQDPGAYRALAEVLASQMARDPDASGAAIGAGEHWGRSLVVEPSATAGPAGVAEQLVDLLDVIGFEPDRPMSPAGPIRLRHCPFGNLARRLPEVVCGVHLGLMRGVLDALGAPSDAVTLEPFVAPDLCLAHLGGSNGG